MTVDDPPADREPEAGAAHATPAAATVERLEDAPAVLLGIVGPSLSTATRQTVASRVARTRITPAWRGENFNALSSRFVNRPPSSACSPTTSGSGSTMTSASREAISGASSPTQSPDQPLQVDGAAPQLAAAAACLVQQRLDQQPDAGGAAAERVEIAPRLGLPLRVETLGDHHRIRLGHHERRDQLVRGDGGEGLDLRLSRSSTASRARSATQSSSVPPSAMPTCYLHRLKRRAHPELAPASDPRVSGVTLLTPRGQGPP